ncbi:MAG TPA: hypothetical protein VM368_00760 [Flavisolibacter sp.]|nr:hypothetical protein [Flavisolibacter sp.]
MKKHSNALQLSGYPLRIVEDNVCYFVDKSLLKIIKERNVNYRDRSSNDKSHVNDPINWDIDWFKNYE